MENSYYSCMNNTKAVACKGTTDCVPEESGWTKYFEDFSNYREDSFSSCLDNSSLVSDADSCALWKKSHKNLKLPKKTRTKIISVDDSLEDTASSPVNSPKVSDLSPVTIHPRKGKEHTLEHYPELQADERSEVNYSGKNINDCTDLRNRGLCLVPLSKLVNYFG
ncbi:hypothetical protein SO802_015504 [Lithocarpus litseifolius]|uniref:Uncharacterized protein n=1 Tax=Lithocarpus litseifolius TaxID=425828 RepID=A0AAW2CVY9_9ROSI